MIIETHWFALQGPRRVDLSGFPFGFLFVWFGRAGRQKAPGRFAPYIGAREFGFFLPWLGLLHRKLETLECNQFIDTDKSLPSDWQQWPEERKEAFEAAIRIAVEGRPGSKIISGWSSCDRRIDLSGRPLQLYRSWTLARA